ncbi:unnamed protein product [Rhizoctonia solani]|uniref:CFEM domain-containing protein n=1 Tax=Rhizoctonia solani TaxID=456999 RepID=A0A8H3A8L3_9AGAM|nr:unnamed protein product [Rhizoctonia solani]CAE6414651.1 unnamed protein product [Rhizoctonia solani]
MKSMFAFAALFAGYAAAQSSTASAAPPISTGDVSTCVLTCSTQAATTAGCTGITDVECLCGSTEFQTAALTCLQAQCPDEVASATALQSQLCGATGSSSASASAPAETSSAAETESDSEATGTASTVPVSATAPGTTSRAVTSVAATSRASTSSVSRSASSVASASASAPANNAASVPVIFNLATGAWAAAALGGAAVAQLVL